MGNFGEMWAMKLYKAISAYTKPDDLRIDTKVILSINGKETVWQASILKNLQ